MKNILVYLTSTALGEEVYRHYQEAAILWGLPIDIETHFFPTRDYGSGVVSVLSRSMQQADALVFDFSTIEASPDVLISAALAVGMQKKIYYMGTPPDMIKPYFDDAPSNKVVRFGSVANLLKEIALDNALAVLNDEIDMEIIYDTTVKNAPYAKTVYLYTENHGAIKIATNCACGGVGGLSIDWENLKYDEIPF